MWPQLRADPSASIESARPHGAEGSAGGVPAGAGTARPRAGPYRPPAPRIRNQPDLLRSLRLGTDPAWSDPARPVVVRSTAGYVGSRLSGRDAGFGGDPDANRPAHDRVTGPEH